MSAVKPLRPLRCVRHPPRCVLVALCSFTLVSLLHVDAAYTPVLKFPVCNSNSSELTVRISNVDALNTTWAGWGTTLARAGRYIGGRSNPSDRQRLLKLLFDPTVGLGLTRLRYQIPPPFTPAASPGVWSSFDHDWSSYLPSKGTYNLSADWKQVLAVQEAVQLGASVGRKIHVDAISLSPPWWMTVSKDVAGGASGQQNIRPWNLGAYAAYLVTLVMKLASDRNVTVDTLAATNEPLEGWWKAGRNRPGCVFRFADLKALYAAVQQQLQRQEAAGVALVGADSWHPSTTNLLVWTYRKDKPPMSVVTVHGYRAAAGQKMALIEAGLSTLRQAATGNFSLPIWQTEWGPWEVGGSELDIAVFMGRSIAEHINIMGASAWFHYLALQVVNDNEWGAIQIDMYAKVVNPQIRKQFYATLHYTRNILEGSTILQVPDVCKHGVVAAYTPQTNSLSVTASNQADQQFSMTLHFSGFQLMSGSTAAVLDYYLTNSNMNYQLIKSEPSTTFDMVTLVILPISITTMVIRNVVPIQ